MSVFRTRLWATLKQTLDTIIDDKLDGLEAELVYPKWMEKKTMSDAYEDDLEVAGPAMAAEKLEGQEMAEGEIVQGVMFKYIALTYALKLTISSEAMEDNKYKETIALAKMNKRAMLKTMDVEATLRLMRAFSATYAYSGTNQPLCSASQPLPHGGTFSNLSGAPAAASMLAVSAARTAVRKYPGHDGSIQGYNLKRVLSPVDQETAWQVLLGSSFNPVTNNFAEINVVNQKMDLEYVPIKHWTNSTTNYIYQTDAPNGLQFRTRKKPTASTWVENGQGMAAHGITARWATGSSEPRSVYGVAA